MMFCDEAAHIVAAYFIRMCCQFDSWHLNYSFIYTIDFPQFHCAYIGSSVSLHLDLEMRTK